MHIRSVFRKKNRVSSLGLLNVQLSWVTTLSHHLMCKGHYWAAICLLSSQPYDFIFLALDEDIHKPLEECFNLGCSDVEATAWFFVLWNCIYKDLYKHWAMHALPTTKFPFHQWPQTLGLEVGPQLHLELACSAEPGCCKGNWKLDLAELAGGPKSNILVNNWVFPLT